MGWIHDQIHGSALFCLSVMCVGEIHVEAEWGEYKVMGGIYVVALLLRSFQQHRLRLFFTAEKHGISWHVIGTRVSARLSSVLVKLTYTRRGKYVPSDVPMHAHTHVCVHAFAPPCVVGGPLPPRPVTLLCLSASAVRPEAALCYVYHG